MKIAIVQYYTNNVTYGKYSKEINEKYALENGYQYLIEEDSSKIISGCEGRSITWYKPKLIKETFSTLDVDYVLYLDIDAIVSDVNGKIENFIEEGYHLTCCEDYGHHSVMNAGVLLFKRGEWTDKFLQEWWNSGDTLIGEDVPELDLLPQNINKAGYFKTALWHDQSCMAVLYKKNQWIRDGINMISNRYFNWKEYNQGNFIFHAFQYGHISNRTIDIIHRERIKLDLNVPSINLIVYHVYCVNDYLKVVKQQLNRLINSGLYDWCDKLEITCVNTKGEFEEIKELIKGLDKVNLNEYTNNDFEYEGVNKVWEYSQKYNGKVFYFHTKGVSNFYKNFEDRSVSEWKMKGIQWWKEAMEYFLIDNFKDCLEKLNTYDQCGLTMNNKWWWGNFWWINLSWAYSNGKPNHGDRWYYEAWLNSYRNPYYYEHYHFEFNPYYTLLPMDIYKKDYSNSRIELISAQYGTLGEQQDEGSKFTQRNMIDVTDELRNNFEQNNNRGFDIRVDNSIKGDPVYGVQKHLEVRIKIDDQDYIIVVDENRNLKIQF